MSVLPAVVTRNWTLKLASLALAVFLWALVRAEPPDREVLTEVPVVVQIGDLDWREAAPPEPATVQVRFAGPARQILALDRRSAVVRIPLDQVSSPDTLVELRRDWVVVAGGSGLVVEDVLPASVTLRLERTVREARPVALTTTGRPQAGYALGGPPTVSPSVVRVRGPEGRLAELDSVRTVPVQLDGLTGATRIMAALDTVGLGDLAVAPLEVEVVVPVEVAAERVLPPVPVEIEGPAAAGLAVDPVELSVTVRGPTTRVEAADLSRLRLLVSDEDVLDVEPGSTRRVPVRVVGVIDPFLTVVPAVDSVTVRRLPGADPAVEDPPADSTSAAGGGGGAP